MKCIPVERPQDLAKKGAGKLVIVSETKIRGEGTQFKKEIMVGDTIKFGGTKIPEQIVDMVISDTDIQLKAPGLKVSETEMSKQYEYKVIPKLD
jgi:glycerol-3-phosphate O-acyltransferase/dihydroxyacetone phosphate acyltransferase